MSSNIVIVLLRVELKVLIATSYDIQQPQRKIDWSEPATVISLLEQLFTFGVNLAADIC